MEPETVLMALADPQAEIPVVSWIMVAHILMKM
jgi:hypothetical protein